MSFCLVESCLSQHLVFLLVSLEKIVMADQTAEKGVINWIEGESQRVRRFAAVSLKTQ